MMLEEENDLDIVLMGSNKLENNCEHFAYKFLHLPQGKTSKRTHIKNVLTVLCLLCVVLSAITQIFSLVLCTYL